MQEVPQFCDSVSAEEKANASAALDSPIFAQSTQWLYSPFIHSLPFESVSQLAEHKYLTKRVVRMTL